MDHRSATEAFNALPRSPLSPSGRVPNHWHFSIRHVPLSPPGLLLFILNPAARYVHTEGPIDLTFNQASAHEKATVVAWGLIKAFRSEALGNVRPWSWSTNDADLAVAVKNLLIRWGVADGLEEVGSSGTEEMAIADESWANLLEELRNLVRGAAR